MTEEAAHFMAVRREIWRKGRGRKYIYQSKPSTIFISTRTCFLAFTPSQSCHQIMSIVKGLMYRSGWNSVVAIISKSFHSEHCIDQGFHTWQGWKDTVSEPYTCLEMELNLNHGSSSEHFPRISLKQVSRYGHMIL